MKLRTTALALLAAGVDHGCATGPDRKPGDPLEPMNRADLQVQRRLDRSVARPVAQGLSEGDAAAPAHRRSATSFRISGDLGNAANNLLQLKITDATEDIMRFAFNSTFGMGGLIDFATPAGLPKHHQDFGLTLGHWGVPSGPYLVLPLFGPSSVRDSMGLRRRLSLQPDQLHGTGGAQSAVRRCSSSARVLTCSARSDLLQAGGARQVFVRARRLYAAAPCAAPGLERQCRAVAELRGSERPAPRTQPAAGASGAPAGCRTTRIRVMPSKRRSRLRRVPRAHRPACRTTRDPGDSAHRRSGAWRVDAAPAGSAGRRNGASAAPACSDRFARRRRARRQPRRRRRNTALRLPRRFRAK